MKKCLCIFEFNNLNDFCMIIILKKCFCAGLFCNHVIPFVVPERAVGFSANHHVGFKDSC